METKKRRRVYEGKSESITWMWCPSTNVNWLRIYCYLGMKLPYQLWSDGEWSFAIAQAVIVWSWLLGGKRK